MTQYGHRGIDPTPIVLLIVLAFLIVLGVAFAFSEPKKTVIIQQKQSQVEEKPVIEQPKKEEQVQANGKVDCTFYQTMYFTNINKPMQSYWYITWNQCLAEQRAQQ